jgi:hypothetical protein
VEIKPYSFWCPIGEKIHPAWEEMDSASIAWMKSFHLNDMLPEGAGERMSRIGVGELAGRTSVLATDSTALQFGSDSLMWLFVFDDAYCDRGVYRDDPASMALLAAEITRIAETGETQSKQPCALALADLRRRADSIADCSTVNHWTSAVRGYLSYQVWEAAHRQRAIVPSVDDYITARIRSGSMEVCAIALGITGSYRVPPQEIDRTDIRALTEMACCIVGLDNDIMSYAKEHAARDVDHINLVDAIAHERHCSVDVAFEEAMQLRDSILDCYLATTSHVAQLAPSPQLRRYLDDLSSWIRGNLDWGLNSSRYSDKNFRATISENTRTLPPEKVSPPGITWWWHVHDADRRVSSAHD